MTTKNLELNQMSKKMATITNENGDVIAIIFDLASGNLYTECASEGRSVYGPTFGTEREVADYIHDSWGRGWNLTWESAEVALLNCTTSTAISCDQCEMLSINGVACHEHGCPNQKKTWIADRGWVLFLECRECGDEVEAGEVCSCQQPDELCDTCMRSGVEIVRTANGNTVCFDCSLTMNDEEDEEEDEVVANA